MTERAVGQAVPDDNTICLTTTPHPTLSWIFFALKPIAHMATALCSLRFSLTGFHPSENPLPIRGGRNHVVAFTLAEVLITLVVIGIVAAISVPILMTRYQKTAVANQVKKVYSTINQAIKLAEIENGPYKHWEKESDIQGGELLEKYLSKYLNTNKITKGIHIHGYMAGGVLFRFQNGSQAVCGKVGGVLSCMVSPNTKGTWGAEQTKYPTRNIFWFNFDQNGKGLIPRIQLKNRNEYIRWCKDPGANNNGYFGCSALLVNDGWEFKDDYPWNIKH